ncbi:hypothetical protein D3C76_1768070 [compost metagenome]
MQYFVILFRKVLEYWRAIFVTFESEWATGQITLHCEYRPLNDVTDCRSDFLPSSLIWRLRERVFLGALSFYVKFTRAGFRV